MKVQSRCPGQVHVHENSPSGQASHLPIKLLLKGANSDLPGQEKFERHWS